MKYNFEEMLNNEEVQKIGYKAANKFKRQLSKDEIDGCFMVALWQACEKYNPNYDPAKIASFFTFFYKGVLFECMKLCKTNSNFKENLKKIKYGKNLNKIKIDYEEKGFSDIDSKDLGLSDKDTKVVIDLFWNNKSIKELSQENNISQPAMKKRIDKILKNTKISRV
jgi:hypothetical protein